MEKDPNQLYRVLEEGFELDSPEAIAKWRESRKRNFPTASNIQRKETDKADTVLRGEKFQPKRLNRKIYRYLIKEEKGRGGRGGNYHRQQQESFHNSVPISSWINHRLPENTSEVLLLESYYAAVEVDQNGVLIRARNTLWDPKLTNEIQDEEERDGAAGTASTAGASAPALDNITITDDEDEFMQTHTHQLAEAANPAKSITESSLPAPTPVVPALQALVAYGTDSELEDGEIEGDAVTEEPILRPDILPASASSQTNGIGPNELPSTSQKYSGVEQSTSVKGDGAATSSLKKNQSRKRRRNKNKDKNPGGVQQRPRIALQKKQRMMRRSDREPTLLRRLLDDQICEERNAVLCGSRFLIQNNFLEGMESSEDVRAEFIDCLRSSSVLEEDE